MRLIILILIHDAETWELLSLSKTINSLKKRAYTIMIQAPARFLSGQDLAILIGDAWQRYIISLQAALDKRSTVSGHCIPVHEGRSALQAWCKKEVVL
jgi:hypothetical protein